MSIRTTNRILARRLEQPKTPVNVAVDDELAKLRKEGKEILSLTVGEPDFPTPPHIIEAAIATLRAGITGYQPVGGARELREAIGEKFRRNNLEFADDQIAVGSGCKQLIFSALCATINLNDEVVVPAPYWLSYPKITRLFGGKPIEIQCSMSSGFKITPAQLEAALNNRTKWVVINSPGNPGGGVYSAAELQALGKVLQKHPSCLILSDEIYENYIYDGNVFTSFAAANPELAHRTLTVNGPSKTFAMPGLRIGYAGAPAFLAKAITAIIAQDTSCAVSASLQAATAALTGDQAWIAEMRASYQKRRDRLVQKLKAIPELDFIAPQGAFYVFPSVERVIGMVKPDGGVLNSDVDVMRYLLTAAHVRTGAGVPYGSSPFLRLSFSTSLETIDRACNALSTAIRALKPGSKKLAECIDGLLDR